jgi:hypothetical protein
MSPAAPDSFFVIFRFGATMELEQSERTSYGVDGADRLRRALSPTFHSVDHVRCGHTRARGWAARCCSTCSIGLVGAAAAGRTMVRSPAAPSPTLVIFRFGATMELGQSGRSMMMRRRRASAASYGVIDNRSENLQH